MLALDALWWAVSARLAPAGKWRLAIAVFMAAQIVGLVCFILGRIYETGLDRVLPKIGTSAVFIWHFGGLALVIAILVLGLPVWAVVAFRKQMANEKPAPELAAPGMSRRQFVGLALAVTPPLMTLGLTGLSMLQLRRFRIRKLELPIAGLPPALDGLTIAHVSDMHVGRFTSGEVLRDIVRATNDLGADLVLLTGDLINDSLDDLSTAIGLVKAMRGRFGVYSIEGNHDLIEDGREFVRRMRESGISFLRNESATVPIRGAAVQLFGLAWTADHERALSAAASERKPDTFPIVLAHHPHAFDAAAAANLSLTLAGHTHGGQLMLTEEVGFGPAMFRYWSGLYTRGASHLVVSNGVGNWFPIRTRAPAEIIHLTLRAA